MFYRRRIAKRKRSDTIELMSYFPLAKDIVANTPLIAHKTNAKEIVLLYSYNYINKKVVYQKWSTKMTKAKTLHAVSDGKVLRPEEAVNLEPNVRYLVTIEREEAIGEQSLWDVLSEFSGTVEGPRDWSEEHDHYLYGTPKRGKGRR